MKTALTQLYSYSELSEQAQVRALAKKAEQVDTDHLGDEMRASLKAVCEACSLRLTDWNFGAYCQDWKAKVTGSADDYQGNKALAWFLRVLMRHGYSRPSKFEELTFPGICGFTGVCYDEDVVETVWKSLLEGETVAEAFDQVAHTFSENWEREDDYQRTPEAILEYLDTSEEVYTEEGEEF